MPAAKVSLPINQGETTRYVFVLGSTNLNLLGNGGLAGKVIRCQGKFSLDDEQAEFTWRSDGVNPVFTIDDATHLRLDLTAAQTSALPTSRSTSVSGASGLAYATSSETIYAHVEVVDKTVNPEKVLRLLELEITVSKEGTTVD